MAPTLPPIVTDLVGGGIRQECATGLSGFNQEQTSGPHYYHATFLFSTNESSPGPGLIELKAFSVCPLAQERHLKKALLVYATFYLIRPYSFYVYISDIS